MTEEESSKRETCHQMWKSYHSKFPDVDSLTSTEYLRDLSDSTTGIPLSKSYTLVDVRSQAERAVSMIPQAVTLDEFESRVKSSPASNAIDEVVVTYCTIGYRSGLEARRLRDKYGLNVMNLDGIVSYTHACSAAAAHSSSAMSREDSGSGHDKIMHLVEPKSQKPTTKVHVFGPAWNQASNSFDAIYFSKLSMAVRGMGVGFSAFLQSLRRFICFCFQSKPVKAD